MAFIDNLTDLRYGITNVNTDLPSEPTSFLTPVLLNNFLSLTAGEFLPDPGAFSLALLPTPAASTIQEESQL